MAISDADLQLMRAERDTDNSDGGGMMTGVALSGGDLNALWDDVDSVEMARGGVSIRRFFPKVNSVNSDKLLGARVAVVKDADSDNVNTVLFKTGDHYAQRADIADLIESYFERSVVSAMRPVGTQRAGQNAIILYADDLSDAPEVGSVFYIEDSVTGVSEYIRVDSVSVSYREFSYENSGEYLKYRAYQFVVGLSRDLLHTYSGLDPAPVAAHAMRIYSTQTRTAATYFGISPLADVAAAGDLAVTVSDVTAALAPVGTVESAIVDQVPGVVRRIVQPSGGLLSESLGTYSGSVVLTLRTGFVPGSLSLAVGSSRYVDKGQGLQLVSGVDRLSGAVISAADGRLTLELSASGLIVADYIPGAAVVLPSMTMAVDVTDLNRQLTYVGNLSAVPDPGSLVIEYRSGGEWYSVSDDGSGLLSGVGASGTINFGSGSYSLVLSAEPDVGSSLLFSWSVSPYSVVSGSTAAVAELVVSLQGYPESGSVVVRWRRGAALYSLTEQPDGSFVGSGSARLVGNDVHFVPSVLPDSDITVEYRQVNAGLQNNAQSVAQQSSGSLVLQSAPGVAFSSINFDLNLTFPIYSNIEGVISEQRVVNRVRVRCNVSGLLYCYLDGGYKYIGSVDSVTGVITVDLGVLNRRVSQLTVAGGVSAYQAAVNYYRVESQTITVLYSVPSAAGAQVSDVVALSDVLLVVSADSDFIVPGSLVFSLGSVWFNDRGDGVLLRSWSFATAAGIQCGSVNYRDGVIELDYLSVMASIASLAIVVRSLSAGVGSAAVVTDVVFRIAGAPLRPGSFQMLARRAADSALVRAVGVGGVVSGSFDVDDVLTDVEQAGLGYAVELAPVVVGAGVVTGAVDYASGVVSVAFSQPVMLSTLAYSAVAYSSLPLDPDVIGIDPLRLPSSGRVPVFKKGGLVLVHHTDAVSVQAPQAGQVVDCGRGSLAVLRVVDALGVELATDQYFPDRAAGSVVFADPFAAVDALGVSLTMPLRVEHRVQDLCALMSVRLDGRLGLMTQLTHDYPAGSLCSSVVELGDLQARAWGLFEQKIDVASEWLDSLVGDPSVAQFDNLNYPVVVDNLGAVSERWKILFRSSSTFAVIGEQRGVIADGVSKDIDLGPINPMTGTPYFQMSAAAFGGGWVTGNVVRFNTAAAAEPIEAVRVVMPSHERLTNQSVIIEFMGDAD